MNKNLAYFIAYKQLKSKWKQSLLAILSVAVGIMILICALSLTNGFEQDLVNKILGTNPHITVEHGLSNRILDYDNLIKKINQKNGVKGASPLIKSQGLLNNFIELRGILVYGINPDIERNVSNWDEYLVKGRLSNKRDDGIVLGNELARRMGLVIGDRVQLTVGVDKVRSLEITGIFQANFYEIDSRVAFINIKQAQDLYGLGDSVNFIAIKLEDAFAADKISIELINELKKYNIRSWLRDNKGLISAMAVEKKVIFIVMMFIIVVAMLGMANLLVMMVLEKNREISILRAIGADKGLISKIFLLQGIIIGVVGIIIGCLGGYALSFLLAKYPISLPGDIYIINSLPIRMEIMDFVYVSLSAFIICILSSLLPARRTVKLNPIETLRRNW